MNSPKTVLGILRVISASGGKLSTRIRLQKEAFLLAISGSEDFNASEFEYHHYGPYSRTLSDGLRLAVSAGLLEEDIEHFEDTNAERYSYKLTNSGNDILSEDKSSDTRFHKKVALMNVQHWRCLELAATVKYLQTHDDISDLDTAFSEAIKLKPATKQYSDQARQLLTVL